MIFCQHKCCSILYNDAILGLLTMMFSVLLYNIHTQNQVDNYVECIFIPNTYTMLNFLTICLK